MIDIHCHVLPEVDDGAGGIDEALAMCRAAGADGVETIIATPHLRRAPWPELIRSEVEERVAGLAAALGADGPRLVPGGEIAVDGELLDELLSSSPGEVVSLAGSRYLLLEFDFWALGPDPAALVYELRIAGWRPIVGHPERIHWLAQDRGLLGAVAAAGGMLQLTGMSVTGDLGRAAQNCAGYLIDEGLAHFVASDGHDTALRPPLLSPAVSAITRVWGEAVARRLTRLNPAAVLADLPLEEIKEHAS